MVPIVASRKDVATTSTQEKTGWDDPIDPKDNFMWETFLTRFGKIGSIKNSRCSFPNDMEENRELHAFSYASELATVQ